MSVLRKYSLKTEIILIFCGMILFDVGYSYKYFKENNLSSISEMLKVIPLNYPLIYLVFCIILSTYRFYIYKKKLDK